MGAYEFKFYNLIAANDFDNPIEYYQNTFFRNPYFSVLFF
ncbi:hypothetical protein M5D96_008779 [Drosophila gunungcola]|uniref:Uncharacterized protein n=1 Tax=Drosophila gunungcola TaxID=103775 RepID=A0A9P9YL45_9MUSC|nr:hypothetical protein M5D96_008779 [Drosophila gunungcola]